MSRRLIDTILNTRYRCATRPNAVLNAYPVLRKEGLDGNPVAVLFVPRQYQEALRLLNYSIAYVASALSMDWGADARLERLLLALHREREAFFADVRDAFWVGDAGVWGESKKGRVPERIWTHMGQGWRSEGFDRYLRAVYYVRSFRADVVGEYVREHGRLEGDPVEFDWIEWADEGVWDDFGPSDTEEGYYKQRISAAVNETKEIKKGGEPCTWLMIQAFKGPHRVQYGYDDESQSDVASNDAYDDAEDYAEQPSRSVPIPHPNRVSCDTGVPCNYAESRASNGKRHGVAHSRHVSWAHPVHTEFRIPARNRLGNFSVRQPVTVAVATTPQHQTTSVLPQLLSVLPVAKYKDVTIRLVFKQTRKLSWTHAALFFASALVCALAFTFTLRFAVVDNIAYGLSR